MFCHAAFKDQWIWSRRLYIFLPPTGHSSQHRLTWSLVFKLPSKEIRRVWILKLAVLTQLPTALGSPLPASRSKQSSCEAAKLRSATQRLSLEFNVTNTLWYLWLFWGTFWLVLWYTILKYMQIADQKKFCEFTSCLILEKGKKKKLDRISIYFFFFYFFQHTACHLTLTLTFIMSFEKINSARLACFITRTVHHTYVIHTCWSNHRLTPPQDTWASVHIYENELEEFKLSFKTNWGRCQ